MPEVLSQGEIDALLSALTSGELSAEEIKRDDAQMRVRTYDFKRAMRFSKEHLRTISRIYEHYSRLLANYLSAQTRTVVQITVTSVDQVPFEEFVRSIPSVTVIHVVDVQPLGGKFLLEMGTDLSFATLDRLFGGTGRSTIEGHKLTEIDTMVLERLFSRSLSTLTTAWSGIADLKLSYDSLEINPQFIQIVNPNDIVLVVSLSVTMGSVHGMINVCMPHVVLESVMPRLSARFAFSGTSHADSEANRGKVELLAKHMDRVAVVMTAELGRTEIQVNDLLNLQIGDVLTLDQAISEPLAIRVGDEVKYRGFPGKVRGHYALKITQVVEEGAENGE
ncbi:flagellar motor switch protein FliM [Sulfoacidibacillus thermotolerans]|uniref:Flagellar motor switch protein FliM n=1 Tax=Sulfoacidibacillus thermotolerans TaxID=1765684 RepID=A0A2U3DAA1_SULT2|nr:flagellar motor switch protein FliM [Sulfoacidibacillus thermotolerans]PWI58195.1 flagellar motor switch protein FliM [Sulfoacidibacillus thermotolerans]